MSAAKQSDTQLLKRLWQLAGSLRGPMVLLVFLDLLAAPVTLLMPYPIKIAVDSVLGKEPVPTFLSSVVPTDWIVTPTGRLWLCIGLIFFIAILQQFRNISAALLRTWCGENLNLRIRGALFQHAQRLSLAYHDKHDSSDTLYRIQYDGVAGEGAIINGVIPMIGSCVTAVVMFAVILLLDWQLTIVAIGVGIALLFFAQLFRPRLRSGWEATKQHESGVLQVVKETLSLILIVKAFGQEHREQQRFEAEAKQGIRAKLRVIGLEGLFGIIIGLAVAAGTASALFIGIRHVQEGALLLGNLVVVMMYLAMLYQPLAAIGQQAAAIQGALASADRAFAVLDETPSLKEASEPVSIDRLRGEVEFKNVSFTYADEQTLQDVSFHIPAGSRVGISGATGSGKTTLTMLLSRFYDATEGTVSIDGTDVRQYSLADLRKQFGILLQDNALISGTIAENIAYGRADATREEIETAATSASAHEFISAQPDGYETQVGERGSLLSGGERQRVALARAYLRNAPILILDEPTSAVDSQTESSMFTALDQLMSGRTTFIISHREGTLSDCDILLKVDSGRVKLSLTAET